MKKALLAISAFGAVFALLISGMAMGVEVEEAPEEETNDIGTEFFYEYQEMLDDALDEFDIEEVEEDITDAPLFSKLVARSYKDLTVGFNSRNSHRNALPYIKNIHGAEDPYLWMMELLEEIGGDEGVNVTDEDEDGIPEKVVIIKRYSNVNEEVDDLGAFEIPEEIEDPVGADAVITRSGGWKFTYIDNDDNGVVESISLVVSAKATVDLDGDGRPEILHSFKWSGRAVDRDQDGDWDMEGYRTRTTYLVDRNGDMHPERRYHHTATYRRIDHRGGPRWDLITASSARRYMVDANSDGEPELIRTGSYNGIWIDRNGNGWPNMVSIRLSSSEAKDRDSDGNKEIKDRKTAALRFIDRNDDKYPELVHISYKRITVFDRDDDGHPDVIRTITKVFNWIDRNSDGRPEMVSRTYSEVFQRPRPRNDGDTSLRDRVKEEIEKRRPNNDRDEGSEPEDRPEKERPGNIEDRDEMKNDRDN